MPLNFSPAVFSVQEIFVEIAISPLLCTLFHITAENLRKWNFVRSLYNTCQSHPLIYTENYILYKTPLFLVLKHLKSYKNAHSSKVKKDVYSVFHHSSERLLPSCHSPWLHTSYCIFLESLSHKEQFNYSKMFREKVIEFWVGAWHAPTASQRSAVGTCPVYWNCFPKSVYVYTYLSMYLCMFVSTHPHEQKLEVIKVAYVKSKSSVLNVCTTRLCSEAASFWWAKNTGVVNLYRLRELLSVQVL